MDPEGKARIALPEPSPDDVMFGSVTLMMLPDMTVSAAPADTRFVSVGQEYLNSRQSVASSAESAVPGAISTEIMSPYPSPSVSFM